MTLKPPLLFVVTVLTFYTYVIDVTYLLVKLDDQFESNGDKTTLLVGQMNTTARTHETGTLWTIKI